MVFPIICISLFSPVTGLWLNWLCRPLLRSDKKKIKKSYQNIQHCKFGHFIISSVVVDHNVLCFSCTKQKNFKYVKMNVLENEKYNIIVLMASAMSWILQGEKWGSCLQSFIRWCSLPITPLLLSPIGVCSSQLHSIIPFGGRAQQPALASKTHNANMLLGYMPGAGCTWDLPSNPLIPLSCLKHLSVAFFFYIKI